MRPNSSNRSERPRRSAVGGSRDILKANGNLDPNYVYRFVNDQGSRIEEMKGYGYEIDQSKDISIGTSNEKHSGSRLEAIADKKTGKKAILMRQPKEYHEEDRDLRAKRIAESEADMLRNVKDPDKGQYGDVSILRDGT